MLFCNSSGKNIKYIKVFGEINSGANFLNKLLANSLDEEITILNHSLNIKSHLLLLEYFIRNLIYTWKNKNLIFEHLVDFQRQEEFSDNFGWKHAYIDENIILSQPKSIETLFIFIVRNPWRAISSLKNNPYHLHPRPSKNLESFIHQGFILMSRDDFPLKKLTKSAGFWNLKNKSYLSFCKKNTSLNFMFINYEDMTLGIENFCFAVIYFWNQIFN